MKIPGSKLLSSISIRPLKRVSASRYYSMRQCSFREVLISNKNEGFLPNSPNALFGRVAHEFLRKVESGEIHGRDQFDAEWLLILATTEKELMNSELNQHLVPLSISVYMYEVKMRQIFIKANKLLPIKKNKISESRLLGKSNSVEKWFETEDKTVGGFIDRIEYSSKGYKIIDFKTGSVVNEDNQIKKEFIYQMYLYAALAYENLKEWPIELVLNDINGNEYGIEYKNSECIELLAEAKSVLNKINETILEVKDVVDLQQLLAKPSAKACTSCQFRPICCEYWNCIDSCFRFLNNDVQGKFMSMKKLENGTCLLKIKSENTIIKVRGLNINHLEFKAGQQVRVYNLSKDRTENCYCANQQTCLYTE